MSFLGLLAQRWPEFANEEFMVALVDLSVCSIIERYEFLSGMVLLG